MNVRIGYIGSAHSVAKNKQLATDISSITLIPFVYEYPYDVPALYQAAQQESDIICFSGIVPYFYRDESLDGNTPVVITPFHEYMVVSSLLTCLAQNDIQLNQISIDLPSDDMMQAIEETIGYSFPKELIYDYQWIYNTDKKRPFPFNEIVQFHLKSHASGKTKMAITSIHYSYDQLKKHNVPVIYMNDYDAHLTQLLIDTKQKVLHAQMNDSMIATLYITTKNGLTIAEDEQIKSLLQTLIPLHTQSEDVHIAQYYTTKGVITKNILQQLDQWIHQMEIAMDGPFSFGIGYGNQLYDAQQNASDALRAATEKQGSNGYIVNETNNRIGPLVGAVEMEELRVDEGWLEEVITTSQTNMKTIRRLIQFMNMHNFQPFTAHELATYSDVTIRTTERFIKKLLQAKVIKSHGQEQHVQQGRPRTVYALDPAIEKKFRTYIQKTAVTTDHIVNSIESK